MGPRGWMEKIEARSVRPRRSLWFSISTPSHNYLSVVQTEFNEHSISVVQQRPVPFLAALGGAMFCVATCAMPSVGAPAHVAITGGACLVLLCECSV